MKRFSQVLLPTCIILFLAAGCWIRISQLDSRPLHFDEGTNARILSNLLETNSASFNPEHNHGPLLSLATAPIAHLRGESTWKQLTKETLRLPVMICGFLTILGALAFCFKGRWTEGLIAAAFVATSPLLVYYSRMYIHETLFLACGIVTLLSLLWFLHNPNLPSCIGMGLGAGLMAATRETFVISLFVWTVVSAVWLLQTHRTIDDIRKRYGLSYLAVSFGLMVLILVLAYSDFGRHPAGLLDFFKTFIAYQPVSGHEKSAWYYVDLLLWPKHRGGFWWTEIGVFLFAVYAVVRDKSGSSRFLFSAGLLHLLVYSAIAYKTPWLASLGWLHICLTAGLGASQLIQRSYPAWRMPAMAVLFVVLSWQSVQSHRSAFRYASDGRNPYAYVPTSGDIERMATWLQKLAAETPEFNQEAVAVVGDFYWPLPWYLRNFDQVGYWPELPSDAAERPLLLLVSDVSDRLVDSHELFPRGLRFEVPVMVAIRKDLWEKSLR